MVGRRALAVGLLTGMLAAVFLSGAANAMTEPVILTSGELKNVKEGVLFCNLTDLDSPSTIEGNVWMKDGAELETISDPSHYMEHKLSIVDYHTAGEYVCVFKTNLRVNINATILVKAAPHVTAYKQTENGNEGEKAVLTCKSHSYPPVTWTWYKQVDGNQEEINCTSDKFEIKSVPEKTELHISSLDIEQDQLFYICEGTNEISNYTVSIFLRVRSRLAPLWPFLGIVVEVIVLVTIIFIYEKRRKPDEVLDDDDAGATPLKSNTATNHKDENVRQRNSN